MKSDSQNSQSKNSAIRHRIHEIIFEADTKMGLVFDVALLFAILASVIVVCLETVEPLQAMYGLFFKLEWLFTILFTIEYVLRLYCVKRPLKYATSFFGVVDLIAVLPSYVGLLFVNAPSLAVVRAFRLLRVFRIFKLIWFMKEADELGRALMRARAKIIVFLGVVVVSITVAGTLMYEIENWGPNGQLEESKFSSIPQSMYWATVTMTTVGYGDIVPTTTLGKFVAAILILLGYSLIIVPTGFVSAEFIEARRTAMTSTQACPYCMLEGHDIDAVFCKNCGNEINEDE